MNLTIFTSETDCIFTLSDSYEQLYEYMQDRTSAASPIALTLDQSSDHFVFRAILQRYLATLASTVEQSHIGASYIARLKVFTSHNGRYESCEFPTSTFYMQVF